MALIPPTRIQTDTSIDTSANSPTVASPTTPDSESPSGPETLVGASDTDTDVGYSPSTPTHDHKHIDDISTAKDSHGADEYPPADLAGADTIAHGTLASYGMSPEDFLNEILRLEDSVSQSLTAGDFRSRGPNNPRAHASTRKDTPFQEMRRSAERKRKADQEKKKDERKTSVWARIFRWRR
ncbi:hypothetical protein BDW22DRAFT_767592 [Trametopsis cervina]|nr:hypothetical protein BDW22DRAFT_767592 [Trametopsis cervina]